MELCHKIDISEWCKVYMGYYYHGTVTTFKAAFLLCGFLCNHGDVVVV
jgi:hypothetical protein